MNGLRLMQRRSADGERSVIAAEGDSARIANEVASTRELALRAVAVRATLAEMLQRCGLGVEVDPAEELEAGRIIAPIDHDDPAHLLMSGTGLTHLGSAEARDQMHRLAAQGQ